jgi:hypothetical protein
MPLELIPQWYFLIFYNWWTPSPCFFIEIMSCDHLPSLLVSFINLNFLRPFLSPVHLPLGLPGLKLYFAIF